jgi:hypothetical protein
LRGRKRVAALVALARAATSASAAVTAIAAPAAGAAIAPVVAHAASATPVAAVAAVVAHAFRGRTVAGHRVRIALELGEQRVQAFLGVAAQAPGNRPGVQELVTGQGAAAAAVPGVVEGGLRAVVGRQRWRWGPVIAAAATSASAAAAAASARAPVLGGAIVTRGT